jgi:hypothetical protein
MPFDADGTVAMTGKWPALTGPGGYSAAAGALTADSTIIRGGKGTGELRGDGIIHVIWKPQGTIAADDALAALATVNEVCRDTECPMLVDMAMTKAVTRDARSIFWTPCCLADGFAGVQPGGSADRQYFPRRQQTSLPQPLFTSRNEAVRWLFRWRPC